LAEDFHSRFGQALDEDSLNQSTRSLSWPLARRQYRTHHRLFSERDIPINVLCFQVFTNGAEQLLSRAWLLDPVAPRSALRPPRRARTSPWNGEFYSSLATTSRVRGPMQWTMGFISGGGGTWYSKTLQLLNPGDRVWVKVPRLWFRSVLVE